MLPREGINNEPVIFFFCLDNTAARCLANQSWFLDTARVQAAGVAHFARAPADHFVLTGHRRVDGKMLAKSASGFQTVLRRDHGPPRRSM